MKKNMTSATASMTALKFQVDLVTRLRFSHIWHNNLFAYADRPSSFKSFEAAEAEANYRNRADGIDLNRLPETFWQVRT